MERTRAPLDIRSSTGTSIGTRARSNRPQQNLPLQSTSVDAVVMNSASGRHTTACSASTMMNRRNGSTRRFVGFNDAGSRPPVTPASTTT